MRERDRVPAANYCIIGNNVLSQYQRSGILDADFPEKLCMNQLYALFLLA